MVCLDRQKPAFADYLSPTLSPMQLVAGCYAPTSTAATHCYPGPGCEPFFFSMKSEPSSPAFSSVMAYSTPSPSDSNSSWSQKLGDGSSNMPATVFWPGDDAKLGQAVKSSISEDTKIKIECSYMEQSTFSSITTPQSDTSDTESVAYNDDEQPPCHQKKSMNDDDGREREALFIKYKDLIIQLYYKMKLEDVLLIMEAQYNLKASKRMYKQRLKAWGIEKNVTICMVQRLLQMLFDGIRRALAQEKPRHLLSGPNTTLLLDVGYFDVVKIQKYIKRNSDGLKKMRDASDRSLDLIRALTTEGGARGRNMGEPRRARLSMPTTRLVQILNLQTSQRAAQFPINLPSPPRRNMAQKFHPGIADPSFQSPAMYTMSTSPAQVLQWPTHSSSNHHLSQAAITLLDPSTASPMDPLVWGDLTAAVTTANPASALTATSPPLEPMTPMQMALLNMWADQHSLQEQVMPGLGHNHDGSMLPPW